MEERSRRIVESAIELAERGGFEAVRLRDVASHANVALGTLYRRFRSKEDLLVAAFDLETRDLERRIHERPPRGENELERILAFFSLATRGLCRRPNLARALLRAAASGEPELAKRMSRYHQRMEGLIGVALRGSPLEESAPLEEAETQLAYTLNLIWFASLVGWSGGLHSQAAVLEQMRRSAAALLSALRA